MRPEVPSVGLEKFALLVPAKSSPSARTWSLPKPWPLELTRSKLRDASSKPIGGASR